MPVCPDCGGYAETHEIVNGDVVCNYRESEQMTFAGELSETMQRAQAAYERSDLRWQQPQRPRNRRERKDIDT